MVTTRAMAMGTRPKAQPLPAKPSKAEKASQAARIKKEKEEKKAKREAAKRLYDAKKAAAKAAKAAKIANAKIGKSTKRATAVKAIATNITKITKAAKKAKATKGRVSAATVKISTNQNEESEKDQYEPQAKRRKLETANHPTLYVKMGPPKEKRADLQFGEWEYMRKADVPEGLENEDNRPLPHIYIGGTAPQPRWVITQSESIKVPSNRHAFRRIGSSSDFGDLHWTFEEGNFKRWAGLEYPALYELAYLCLEYTLADTKIREQIYESLAQGPLPKAVTVGSKWHPALPPIPITRYFATGSSQQTSRKSSDAAFYFRDYERPLMAVRAHTDHMVQPYPHALDYNISNRPSLMEWPTASRSASLDPESERGSNQGSEEVQLVDSRRSSMTGESDLELNPEGIYSEPTTPTPLGNDEKIAHEEGSIFGDTDDVQVESSSAQGSREQSPNSLFSGSGSDSEVSTSSMASEPNKLNAADDLSAQSTNSLSPVSHDGLFSPGQIARYFKKKRRNFERLGGVELRETSERKRQAQLSPVLEALEDVQKEGELETRGVTESSKRMRTESPSTPSPPASRRKTAAESMMETLMSFARVGQGKRDENQEAAAEKISDKPPVALLKKTTTGNRLGARSQADAPSPEIPPNLQDGFLEQTKAYLKDPAQRARHFPDPLAVRRARVWAGEELVDHAIQPIVDATLPPWAERHRPFSQWRDPTEITPTPAARNKVSRTKRRSKGQVEFWDVPTIWMDV
ncbi:hypothetical protein PDIG_66930 [Penicillium digitatum PHI26]|uniref:Uncharacterized protein n=2 Tax=Penicillium digitatum TaxID=36651 RepID=K9FHY5_PEND2|nr:hypothetical protein PDIP_76230 [Penicillium digitatum Pd1]EKV06802.1 hypothetical protein PDIP_76230 [Penicillium digitatum Pd1]EKV08829.1 hypothetical protein PDIG_66930 [Penicillium digitatum PHI26]